MPLRYAIAFIGSYGVFFLCVRVWCGFVRWNRGDASGGTSFDVPVVDPEGCLWIIAVGVAASIPAFLFWLTGGFAALQIVGRWAHTLLAGTWMHALAMLLIVVAAAALLQAAAPQADTFAQAISAITKH